LGLGLSRIGSYTSGIDRADARKLLEAAFDCGINVFDTADIYGQGDSESLLGSTFRKRRSEVVICTKVGYRLSARARIAAFAKPLLKPVLRRMMGRSDKLVSSVTSARSAALRQDFSASYLQAAIDASLRRLQTDYVDLLLLHSPPLSGIRPDEVQPALNAARSAGKIRAYGISSLSPSDAEAWISWPGIAAIQLRFNRIEQGAAARLVEQAKLNSVGIIAREVLSAGGMRPGGNRAEQVGDPEAIKLALCAPLELDPVNFVLVGTTRIDHLREDVAAIAEMFVR
jgi:aryl-alcohol dehydrogenase-like predicted oxidoreductase